MPYRYLRSFLFKMEPERAHDVTMNLLSAASLLPVDQLVKKPEQSMLQQRVWGQTFHSPLGLAAGLDKNARAIPAFSCLGFGFLEVGTVTPLAQAGNPTPRLFRLPSDHALINRMGFNNLGAEQMQYQLKRIKRTVPIWVNIGKNKTTQEAHRDYVSNVRMLQEWADAFVINVSSPNTPGLRALQSETELVELIQAVHDELERGRVRTLNRPPVLVKLAPDLDDQDFEKSVQAALQAGVNGLVISNTTLSRAGLTHLHAREQGGLSGRPLAARSTELLRQAYRIVGEEIPLVGVGGIWNASNAYEKIKAGATLIELYTALIYRGPEIVQEINKELTALLQQDGFSHISQARGIHA